MSMRRFLIIFAIVIVVLGIGAAAYMYFVVNSPSVVVAPAGNVGLPTAPQGTPPLVTDQTPVDGIPAPVSARLVKISVGPVVPGAVVVSQAGNISASSTSPGTSSPEVVVKFIERQSGNVFSYLTRTGALTRTSNKTIPGIESAAWLPDGTSAFVRYLSGSDFSTINTYALPATGSGEQGFFLPQNLSGISVSSSSVLSLASGVNGSTASVGRTSGTNSSQIFTTPLTALRVSFAGKNQYLAFTKPSSSLAGDAFLVDGAGHFSRIAGPLGGLVALASPSGKFVLVSYVEGATMQMQLVNTATGEVLALPVATITDKCVWSANEASVYCGIPENPSAAYAYPDDWYQGAVAFSDRIWKIDVAGRFAQLVLDFSVEAKSSLDAEALSLDPAQTTLVFVNKNDGSLWSYSL